MFGGNLRRVNLMHLRYAGLAGALRRDHLALRVLRQHPVKPTAHVLVDGLPGKFDRLIDGREPRLEFLEC